ncbi:formate hydrogenlyase regulator HycA [Erwinia sp.]|uniref:formate hydrogenlyase regulator HycA n=1 Tax=Erwinia citreus TaxID=558 RepID=UPI00289D218F|nr:formate hydrogenlyase regulator HycA [Erwinia sp.]
MSTLSELTNQAEYIASKNNTLKAHWHTYQNVLTQAVTLSGPRINHTFTCSNERGIHFTVFNHFIISIHLEADFYSQRVVYSLNMAQPGEPNDFEAFAWATLTEEGRIDNTIDIHDRQAVLEHYINKIALFYQCIYDAIYSNTPLHPQLEKLIKKF